MKTAKWVVEVPRKKRPCVLASRCARYLKHEYRYGDSNAMNINDIYIFNIYIVYYLYKYI